MKKTEYISEIDSMRFGFKIARINDFNNQPEQIIKDLKNQSVKLVISTIRSNNVYIINTLENLGFEYKDTLLKYQFLLNNPSQLDWKTGKNIQIRTAKKKDIEELMNIAGEAFKNQGHYFADHKLDKTKCNDLYKDWIKNCCLDKNIADIVFLAEKDSEIAGFLSYKILSENNQQYSRTLLGAVKKKLLRLGVYTTLLKKGFIWGVDHNLAHEEHFVSLTNIPINQVFYRLGFKMVDSFITLHGWL